MNENWVISKMAAIVRKNCNLPKIVYNSLSLRVGKDIGLNNI